MMKSMQLTASAACVCAVSMLSACYSPDRFRSENADILVVARRGNPKYHIFFEQAELVAGTNEHCFEFSNPPPTELLLHLILLSEADEERLKARNARLTVKVTDSDGLTAYACEVSVGDLTNPMTPTLYVRPPAGWCSAPKGNVVYERYYWRHLKHMNGQEVWVYGVPHMGIVRVGRMKLGSTDYRLRITVTLDDADEPPIQFHTSLAGGWHTSL